MGWWTGLSVDAAAAAIVLWHERLSTDIGRVRGCSGSLIGEEPYWQFMASIIETVILGLVQGLTEWLPVSSSGHLAIAAGFLDWQPPVVFYVLLHVGTLIVIVAFFRQSVAEILTKFAARDFQSDGGRLGLLVITGSVPTAVVGYVFRDLFKSFFENLLVVGGALFATGFLLVLSETRGDGRSLNYVDSVLVGLAQGIAIIPGVSRSGATISTGFLRRVQRESAFRFSFLLSIPAVVGATLAEAGDLSPLIGGEGIIAVAAGVLVSMVVGYLSLKALQRVIVKHKFHWFAIYCWAVGALVMLSQLW
jgi:undecaprenyl-diphosphatase